MDRKMNFRLSIDLAMTVLMLVAMAYQMTGNLVHELIGVTMFVLLFVHNLLNRRWYGSIFKGRYTVCRALSTATNLLLLVVMLLLMMTGLLISRDLFAFLRIKGGFSFTVRRLHTFAANWGLILMSVHLGTHWAMIMGIIRRMTGIATQSRTRIIIIRMLVALVVLYGVKSSFDLDIGSKLTMQFTFSYWDFEKAAPAFFIAYLSVMGIYIATAYYGCKLLKKWGKVTNE
ncbi:DUF4405 domain-containing protein [Neomoorella thermoacetica]|uniref:DUF4405 domain-containing protein n=1 Tax=Neomoorella thermoacetica TaxID=1525 RepID=UPI000470FBA5|nr:DUF4405 domain-containing protein [Moorella thermoacetica]